MPGGQVARGRSTTLRPRPGHNVSVRLNDYHLAMLQYVAEAMDTSQQKILRRQLIPVIEIMAEEAHAKQSPANVTNVT